MAGRLARLAGLLAPLLQAWGAHALPVDEVLPNPQAAEQRMWSQNQLLGDWGGVRTRL